MGRNKEFRQLSQFFNFSVYSSRTVDGTHIVGMQIRLQLVTAPFKAKEAKKGT
jgi:hypothetical protein